MSVSAQTLVSYPRESVRGHAAELYAVVAAAVQDDRQFTDSLRLMHQLATSKVRRAAPPVSDRQVTAAGAGETQAGPVWAAVCRLAWGNRNVMLR